MYSLTRRWGPVFHGSRVSGPLSGRITEISKVIIEEVWDDSEVHCHETLRAGWAIPREGPGKEGVRGGGGFLCNFNSEMGYRQSATRWRRSRKYK